MASFALLEGWEYFIALKSHVLEDNIRPGIIILCYIGPSLIVK